ncbi:MAG: MOSC domain-containing protein [Pseudomonadota bacterium]
MDLTVAGLWRHPIKAIGAEPLEQTALMAGETMPGDRVWAVAHAASKADTADPKWLHSSNFNRGAQSPELMAIGATSDPAVGRVTLTHPRQGEITLTPDRSADQARLLAWLMPLVPENRPGPTAVYRVPGLGITDSPFPSISIITTASLRALEGKVGRPLDQRRFRCNIWLDGAGPWQEFEWVGKEAMLGTARVRIVERSGRCLAPAANPETGARDADILGALEAGWGHTDFGVYAEVIADGEVQTGDRFLPL